MAEVLYFDDGTREILMSDRDFAEILRTRLGKQAEDYFCGCIEELRFEADSNWSEVEQLQTECEKLRNAMRMVRHILKNGNYSSDKERIDAAIRLINV